MLMNLAPNVHCVKGDMDDGGMALGETKVRGGKGASRSEASEVKIREENASELCETMDCPD